MGNKLSRRITDGLKRMALLLLLALTVAACAKSADKRIMIQPDVRLTAEAPRIAVGDDKLLRVSTRINNGNSYAVKAYITVEWSDGQGQKVDSLIGTRAPLAVPSYGSEDFSITAPRPDIIGFRIRIESRE
ncbi:MAG: hypothetical protein QM523_04690 [Candidatus Pacebacteria bacterium]|nr:hypothetical protein [Candidatus Paceibacterota bacterium]